MGIDFTSPDGPDLGGRLDVHFSSERIHLPARHGGSGILRLKDRADAIYASTLSDCLPDFIDRTIENDQVQAGICTFAAPLLGVGSFDGGKKEGFWSHFFASKSRAAAELKGALERLLDRRSRTVEAAGGWDAVKASMSGQKEPDRDLETEETARGRKKRAPDNPIDSPLGSSDDFTVPRLPEDIEATPGSKMQRRISHEFYQLKELELRARASRLDITDQRRLAFHNSDRFSREVFTALPDNYFRPTKEIYKMAAATCLGLPLSIAMGNAGRTVDRYGFKLSNDATAHTRHTLHNSLRDRIIYFMRLGSSTVSKEPKDLLLSATGRPMIPDIAYHEEEGPNSRGPRLLDIKTLGGGAKQYTSRATGDLPKGAHVREQEVPRDRPRNRALKS